MRKSLLFLILVLIFTFNVVHANDFDIGECYPIDGPANIRNEPGGKVVDSLGHGKFVRIKKKNDSGWYFIEYMSHSNQNLCPTQNDTRLKKGWTYKNNLAIGLPLVELINKGKVLIANQVLFPRDVNKFLNKPIALHKDYGELGVPKIISLNEQLKINVYSLSGVIQNNEVISFQVVFDAGYQAVTINTKHKLPEGCCVLVNGFINEFSSNYTESKMEIDTAYTVNLFPDPKKMKWSIETGDLNNDGVLETIVNEVCIYGVYTSRWFLYQKGVSLKKELLIGGHSHS